MLLESLKKCLCVALTLKITELIKCFGCRDSYTANFMHDCMTKTRSQKWSECFDRALYQIDIGNLAKDLVLKNLNVDFDTVLGIQEFFDCIIVKEVLNAVQKMYIGEEEPMYDNDCLSSLN